MTNTRAQGDAFRDRVFALLRMVPGIRNLAREKPIQHQAVDIYYEEVTSFGTLKVACECKDYGTPLTRKIIEKEIWPKYAPLLDRRDVEAVRIITPLPVAVDAQRYLDSIHFRLTTLHELESGIMDFGAYLQSMLAQYSEEGLDTYYCPATVEGSADAGIQVSEDAEAYLTSWIARHGPTRPIAILATYGMGKSSLAKRLAWVQARRHIEDRAARIPIFIPLGDISTEQDIRGLITKHLAAQHVVHNFHYELFRELNRRGRFVLIFDGFDEMKHTMSFSDIRFNFSEINRLVEDSARVLLLGRPTVFKDGHERQYALHGVRENQRRVADFVDYVELELSEFDARRSLEMMRAYGAYAIGKSRATRDECISSEMFEERLAYIERDEEMALLSRRPVQAKMLVDLAIDPQVEWRRFSRYELYEEFVVQFLEREARKVARKRFSQEQRAAFQSELAWWMWRTDHTSGFEMRALPRDLYGRHVQHADEGEGVARDLVTGTILDLKPPDRYFFRHRSYLEFLVAQHVCTAEWTPSTLRAVSDTLTDEVAAFVKESPERTALDSMMTFVNDIEGPISGQFVDLLGFHLHQSAPDKVLGESASARSVFIYWASLRDLRATEVMHRLARAHQGLTHRESRIAAIVCMMLTADRASNVDSAARKSYELMRPPIAVLLVDTQDEMRRLLDAGNDRAGAALDPEAYSMRLLAASLRTASSATNHQLFFDGESFFDVAAELLEDTIRLRDWGQFGLPLEPTYTLVDLAKADADLAPTRPLGALVQRFFRQFHDPRTLVRVTKGRIAPAQGRASTSATQQRRRVNLSAPSDVWMDVVVASVSSPASKQAV